MKLTKTQLRSIIREEVDSMTQAPKRGRRNKGPSMWDAIPEDSPDYGASSGQKVGHLSQLKAIDPRAYKGFVEMLVEDCTATFEVAGDGTITAKDRGKKLTWNPNSTSMDVGGGWE